MYGGEEKCKVFWLGNVRERGHFQDLVVDGRSVLKWVCKAVRWVVVDRIDLAQSRNKW